MKNTKDLVLLADEAVEKTLKEYGNNEVFIDKGSIGGQILREKILEALQSAFYLGKDSECLMRPKCNCPSCGCSLISFPKGEFE